MAVELSEAERASVQEELKVLGDKIRAMKADNADPEAVGYSLENFLEKIPSITDQGARCTAEESEGQIGRQRR